MQTIDKNIWVVDGNPVPFFGFPYTTRMTVVRLPEGELWLHSPIQIEDALINALSGLGRVAYLIAPNHLHHLFLPEWKTAFPDAKVFGTQEVIKKRTDITFDGALERDVEWPWVAELDQLMFTGSPAMQECVFFHHASRTLIVTDLIENFSGDGFKPWQRLVAKGAGIMAPNGKMPVDWRVSFMFGKAKARRHLKRMIAWNPERIIMAHGEIIPESGTKFLKSSFHWLD